MKTQVARKQTPATGKMAREMAEQAAHVRLMYEGNRLDTQKQSLTATGSWGEPMKIEFVDRKPYGCVFAEGQEASFRVPSGHRFVIEHVNVLSWGAIGTLSTHLVTISPRVYRCVEVAYLPAADAIPAVFAVIPIVVNGLSANTFLFSEGKLHNSATIPAETYLQIWGYLEPSHFPVNDSQDASIDASSRGGIEANLNRASR